VLLLAAGCPLFAVAMGALAWVILRHRHGWSDKDVVTAALTTAGLALSFAIAFGGRFLDSVVARPVAAGAVQLEEWRALLRAAVLRERIRKDGSHLRQMVRHGTVVDARAREQVDLFVDDLGRPRLRIRGRTVPFSEITRQWDQSPSRLVILGEPGYGKTVAALMLVAHINAEAEDPGQAVAELFPLAEWYRWHADHPGAGMEAWLADQLTTTYPDLPRAQAAALISADLVMPVLDGLDEVPASDRIACRDAIDAYAGHGEPYRPFVLTCRAREYAELETDWVPADHQVILVGLEPDQVAEILDARTSRWPEWAAVRDGVRDGDRRLCELFRSPLRLGIALQAYRGRDPEKLVGLDLDAAKRHLWDALLALGGDPGFGGSGPQEVRSWLDFLAMGMRRESRQRLWLHELYLLAPNRPRELQTFRRRIGLMAGLFAALTVEFPILATTLAISGGSSPPLSTSEMAAGLALDLLCGSVVGVVVGLGVGLSAKATPTVSRALGWRTRLSVIKVALPQVALVGLVAALVFGVVMGAGDRMTYWPRTKLAVAVVVAFVAAVVAGLNAKAIPTIRGAVRSSTRTAAIKASSRGIVMAAIAAGTMAGISLLALVLTSGESSLGMPGAEGIIASVSAALTGVAIGGGVVAGTVAAPVGGLMDCLVFGVALGFGTGLVGRLASLQATGVASALQGGLILGALVGLLVGLAAGLPALVSAGASTVVADPPRRLAGRGTGAVLTATRNAGLIAGLLVGTALDLVVGLGAGWTGGGGLFTAVVALVVGVSAGLVSGLDAWFCYHWLRRRLARKGYLPRRLEPFLEWCALPERGWLRISDAYEFRHRELLDHLVSDLPASELRVAERS
jgi:hypothetical protein